MTRDIGPYDNTLRAEALALGFDLTDDQLRWVAKMLARHCVTFIDSRRVGRDYALKAAVAIERARHAR